MLRQLNSDQPGKARATIRTLLTWILVLSFLPAPGISLNAVAQSQTAQPNLAQAAASDAAVNSFGAGAKVWPAFQNPDGSVIVTSPDGRQVVLSTPTTDSSTVIEIWQRDYKGQWEYGRVVNGTYLSLTDTRHKERFRPPKPDSGAKQLPPAGAAQGGDQGAPAPAVPTPEQQQAALQALQQQIDANAKAAYDNLIAEAKNVKGPRSFLNMTFPDYTVATLLLVRKVYIQQLKFFQKQLIQFNNMSRAEKVNVIGQALPAVSKAKLWKYLWSEFRAGKNLGWITTFQEEIANARNRGDVATANAMEAVLDNSRNGRAAQERMIQTQFFRAMDSNPVVGMLFNAIKGDVTGGPEAYVGIFDKARTEAFVNAATEIDRWTAVNTVEGLAELLSPQYAAVWNAASPVLGKYSKGMISNLLGMASSYQELKGLDKEVTDLYLAGIVGTLVVISILIPPVAGVVLGKAFVPAAGMVATGVGFGAGTVQLTYDGVNYFAASKEAQNAQSGSAVLGASAVNQVENKASDALQKVAFDVPFLIVDGVAFAAAAKEAQAARQTFVAGRTGAATSVAVTAGTVETASGIRTATSVSERIQNGLATARRLGVAEAEIQNALKQIDQLTAFAAQQTSVGLIRQIDAQRAVIQKAILAFDELNRFARELGLTDAQLVAMARARGVELSLGAFFDSAMAGKSSVLTKDLFAAVLNKRGVVIVVDNASIVKFNEFFSGATVRPRFVVTDAVNLQTVNTNLGFMMAGKPVKWTEQQLTALRNLVAGRGGNPAMLYKFDSKVNEFTKIFSEEELAYAEGFLNAKNFAAAAGGTALPQFPLLAPSVLVDQTTGTMISATRASQLTADEIKQIPVAYFNSLDQNSPLFKALAARINALTAAQPAAVAPAVSQWAQKALTVSGAATAVNAAAGAGTTTTEQLLTNLGQAIGNQGNQQTATSTGNAGGGQASGGAQAKTGSGGTAQTPVPGPGRVSAVMGGKSIEELTPAGDQPTPGGDKVTPTPVDPAKGGATGPANTTPLTGETVQRRQLPNEKTAPAPLQTLGAGNQPGGGGAAGAPTAPDVLDLSKPTSKPDTGGATPPNQPKPAAEAPRNPASTALFMMPTGRWLNPAEAQLVASVKSKAKLEAEGIPQAWTRAEVAKLTELSQNPKWIDDYVWEKAPWNPEDPELPAQMGTRDDVKLIELIAKRKDRLVVVDPNKPPEP